MRAIMGMPAPAPRGRYPPVYTAAGACPASACSRLVVASSAIAWRVSCVAEPMCGSGGHARMRAQRRIQRQRFGGEHVEAGGAQVAAVERLQQRRLLHRARRGRR